MGFCPAALRHFPIGRLRCGVNAASLNVPHEGAAIAPAAAIPPANEIDYQS
jgi:hypothetical protein